MTPAIITSAIPAMIPSTQWHTTPTVRLKSNVCPRSTRSPLQKPRLSARLLATRLLPITRHPLKLKAASMAEPRSADSHRPISIRKILNESSAVRKDKSETSRFCQTFRCQKRSPCRRKTSLQLRLFHIPLPRFRILPRQFEESTENRMPLSAVLRNTSAV